MLCPVVLAIRIARFGQAIGHEDIAHLVFSILQINGGGSGATRLDNGLCLILKVSLYFDSYWCEHLVSFFHQSLHAEAATRLAAVWVKRIFNSVEGSSGETVYADGEIACKGHWVATVISYTNEILLELLIEHFQRNKSARTPATPCAGVFFYQCALLRNLGING